MTTDAMIGLCFLVAGLLMFALRIGVALLKAAKKPAPEIHPGYTGQVPPASRKLRGPLTDGFCPVCSRPGTYLNHDGSPNRRFHSVADCVIRQEAALVTIPNIESGLGRSTIYEGGGADPRPMWRDTGDAA